MDREHWKWSCYNIVERIDDIRIFYNTRTSAILSIETEKVSSISKILCADKLPEDCKALIKGGFLVEKGTDETELVRQRYLAQYHKKNRLNLVLLPSETCNLCCPYCFIYKYAGSFMSEETMESVFKFIENQLDKREESSPFYLKISWYGGEPLLRPSLIFSLMGKLNKKYEKNEQINIQGLIITNGVNLNRKTFDELISCGVNTFQITFDGGKNYHDNTRRFKDGRGSFDTIIQNLKSIVSSKAEFKIAIRINFLRSSLQSIEPLIDELLEIFGDDKRFSIYCRPVYNFETSRDDIESLQGDILTYEEGFEKQIHFSNYIYKKQNENIGFGFQEIPHSIDRWCHADNDHSFTIGSDGLIYRCDTLVGDSKFSVGRLKTDGSIEDFDYESPWNKDNFSLESFSKCKKCRLLPVCLGACKRNVIENKNGCAFTEEHIREALRKTYKTMKKGGE